MKYFLPEIVSFNSVYNVILPDLSERYLSIKRDENVTLSLIYTERIDSNAIPLFMCILNILWNYHQQPVDLELVYNPRLLYFLDRIDFFRWGSQLNLIRYDEDLIGGFGDYIKDKRYRTENSHKILAYWPKISYLSLPPQEKQNMRDKLTEELKYEMFDYVKLIALSHNLSDGNFEILRTATSEIILNAILYSQSMCYVYVQSGIKISAHEKKILISVVDIGEGFRRSLDNQLKEGLTYNISLHNNFCGRARKIGIAAQENKDYLSIMEALYYSELQDRDMNLYHLKNMLADNHANLRIHYNTTQIVFTYTRCSRCGHRGIFNCMNCLMDKRILHDEQKSPVKIFKKPLAGVHIDVEFITEDI